MTDFDRHAIGSLEDFQRELSSLEQQRTQVEEKLKAFDTTGAGRDRGPAGAWRSGRGGGGSGRGVWGGRGGWGQGGREGERGERNGGQNGIRCVTLFRGRTG